MHLLEPACAVITHARHDDAHGILPGKLGHRAEQHIHRRAVAVHRGAVFDFDDVLRTAARQLHMLATRGHQGQARQHTLAVLSLFHLDLAYPVQALRKGRCKHLRHVLHDDNAGAHPWQGGEQLLQGNRAAGRGANRHNPLGRSSHGVARRRTTVHLVQSHLGGCRCTHLGIALYRPHIRPRSGLHRRDQIVTGVLQKVTHAQLWFGNDGHRPRCQCLQGRLCPGRGERRTNHHRGGPLFHQLGQKGDAIHTRHFHVQRHHIGPVFAHFFNGKNGVWRGAYHLNTGVRFQQTTHHLAHYGRVVHHHYFDLLRHGQNSVN